MFTVFFTAVLVLVLLVLRGAPTPTARGTPTGYKMPDGFKAHITFASNATISFWEKQVKPPALDGGEPIDTSTMFNTRWHTFASRQLIKMDALTATCAYDPNAIPAIFSLINVDTTITVTWMDGGTLAFFGWLQKVEFGELKEGEFPEATLTIFPANCDGRGQAEEAPVYTAGSGT